MDKIPTLEAFKKATNEGFFSFRADGIKAIDKAIEKFNAQTTDYGKKWNMEEVRIALDQWKSEKASKGEKWKEDEYNKKGMLTALDNDLPQQKPPPTLENSAVLQETAENLRKGTLYFLAKANMDGNIADKLMTWAGDTSAFVGDCKELAANANPAAAAQLLKDIKDGGFINPELGKEPPATPTGFVAGVINAVRDLLAKLVDQVPGEGAEKAAAWISEQAPAVVCELLGSVVSVLGAAVGIISNLVKAVSAGIDYFKTRNLEGGILSGQPKLVIESIRQQILGYALEGLMAALMDALMAGLNAANPAIASIASAVRSILGFIAKAFFHFKQVFKFRKLMVEAKDLLENKFYEKTDEFYDWYKQAICDLPILSCYCLAMPMTGNFTGFLNQVCSGKKGSGALTQEQLKENYDLFEDVKVRARQFVKENSIKLNSEDPIVKMSIDVAVGKKLKIEG